MKQGLEAGGPGAKRGRQVSVNELIARITGDDVLASRLRTADNRSRALGVTAAIVPIIFTVGVLIAVILRLVIDEVQFGALPVTLVLLGSSLALLAVVVTLMYFLVHQIIVAVDNLRTLEPLHQLVEFDDRLHGFRVTLNSQLRRKS